MKDHLKILEMIEAVDPNDGIQMLKIDTVTQWFLKPEEHIYYSGLDDYISGVLETFRGGSHYHVPPRYTRSRDALKSIRPDGWLFSVFHEKKNPVCCTQKRDKDWVLGRVFQTPPLPTEELAELHAIVQAIAYGRGLNDD